MTDKKVSELNEKPAQEGKGVSHHYYYPFQVTPIEPSPMVKILNQNATILRMNEEILKQIAAEPKVNITFGGGGSGGGGNQQVGKIKPAGPAQDDERDDSKGYDGATPHLFGRADKVSAPNAGGGVEGFGGGSHTHNQQTSLSTPGGGGDPRRTSVRGGATYNPDDNTYTPAKPEQPEELSTATRNDGFTPIGYPR